MHRILLDTDIGSDIDDALALLLLLHLPDVELIGISTVYGKVAVRARIARKILALAAKQIPVAAGIGFPLRPAFPVWHTGVEGVGLLDDGELSDMGTIGEPVAEVARFIVERSMSCSGQITLTAIGPLTNIAMALDAEPRLADSVKELVFMGAGVTYPREPPEEILPDASFHAKRSHNVGCDVEAAQRVFSSRLPIRVLTNDVTTRLWWDGPSVQQLTDATEPPESAAVGSLLQVWLEYRSRTFGQPITGTCPHDPLTVAEAVYPGRFVEYVRGRIRIMDDGSSMFEPDPHGPHEVGIRVAEDRFINWMIPRLLGTSDSEEHLLP